MKSHSGSWLEISKLEEASTHVSVVVEKSEKFVFEFREFLLTRETKVIFHIVVQKMNSFCFEKCTDFWILVDDVSKINLVNIGVKSFVSESGPEEHPGKQSQAFEAKSQIPELEEEKWDWR